MQHFNTSSSSSPRSSPCGASNFLDEREIGNLVKGKGTLGKTPNRAGATPLCAAFSRPKRRGVAPARHACCVTVFCPRTQMDPSSGPGATGINKSELKNQELVVGARRFERRTSCAQGRRATRLRYAPTVTALFILK